MARARRSRRAEPEAGEAAGEDGPERRCIVSRRTLARGELIRFVRAPDGEVVPDLKAALPGRGAWVEARAARVAEAARRGLFARAFKQEARAPEDLAARVGALLRRRALEAFSLANKAGRAVAGFAKVEAALRAGDVAALVHAAEAGQDGTRRLAALAKGLDARVETIQTFRSHELDLALGRANVIHAALKVGEITDLAIARARAAQRYDDASPSGGDASFEDDAEREEPARQDVE